MSSALYAIRLYWNGRLGQAKYGRVIVELTTWPHQVLPGVHVAEMDFAPEVRCCTVRECAAAWRDMSGTEIAAARTWLQRLAERVQAIVDEEEAPR